VWLNTPHRPKEASGTSGMKVTYNGGLNCSILDGWWAEGYSREVGWAIGAGEEYEERDWEQADFIESEALYNILEHDIVPMFYDRGRDGLPRAWLAKIKNAIRTLGPYFNTRRMVQEYAQKYYMPCFQRTVEMSHPNLDNALAFAAWRSNVEKVWRQVAVRSVNLANSEIKVGTKITVEAVVQLGLLTPNDVRVQLYYGELDTRGEINSASQCVDMQPTGGGKDGEYTFKGEIANMATGDRGVSVRVMPQHAYLPNPFIPSLITWA
jgi:starch phosphorylase